MPESSMAPNAKAKPPDKNGVETRQSQRSSVQYPRATTMYRYLRPKRVPPSIPPRKKYEYLLKVALLHPWQLLEIVSKLIPCQVEKIPISVPKKMIPTSNASLWMPNLAVCGHFDCHSYWPLPSVLIFSSWPVWGTLGRAVAGAELLPAATAGLIATSPSTKVGDVPCSGFPMFESSDFKCVALMHVLMHVCCEPIR